MTKSVLVADDSLTIRTAIQMLLSRDDVSITTADNGSDALRIAKQTRPQLVLVDCAMPGLSGYDVCESIKQDPELSGIPVLLLTGNHEPYDESRARASGADGAIFKPFESGSFLDAVRAAGGLAAPVGASVPAPAQRPVTHVVAPPPAVARPATIAPFAARPPTTAPAAPVGIPPAVARPATIAPFAAKPPTTAPAAPVGIPRVAPARLPTIPQSTGMGPLRPIAMPQPARAPVVGHGTVAPPVQPLHAVPPVVRAIPAAHDGGEAQLREVLSKTSREVIEKIAWEVVPQLAETIIKEHVERMIASQKKPGQA